MSTLTQEIKDALDAKMRDGSQWFFTNGRLLVVKNRSDGGGRLSLDIRLGLCQSFNWEFRAVNGNSYDALAGFNPCDKDAVALLAIMVECLSVLAEEGVQTPIITYAMFQEQCALMLSDTPHTFNRDDNTFTVDFVQHDGVNLDVTYHVDRAYAAVYMSAHGQDAALTQMQSSDLMLKALVFSKHLNDLWGGK